MPKPVAPDGMFLFATEARIARKGSSEFGRAESPLITLLLLS
jgi:hypothetical protein